MNAKNEILEELRLLSAVVNDISRDTPYRVPAGYFDGFPALMLSLTGEAPGAEGPFFAKEKDKPLTFSVPEGYFEGFAQGVLDKIKAGSQITAQQPGSGISPDSRQNEATPDPRQELAELSPLLNGISRILPYQAPEGYFEELSPILAPLAEVREKPLYSVPEGYFERLAGEILSKINPAQGPSPPDPGDLHKPEDTPGSVLVEIFGSCSCSRSYIYYRLAAFANTALNSPLCTRVADVASNLVKISDQDLQNFLDDQNDQESYDNSRDYNSQADDNSPTAESMNSTATLDITDSDVKSLLGDVPDGELKTYMEEHGGANDIATN